ncbi:MAG: DNA-binding response regulator [Flavobacterium sp.]|nr:DNA-binding response regulator [Flavobacterium sp.]
MPPMNNEVRIFLADDHPIFREGLINIIQQEKRFMVCNSAGDGNSALEIIRKEQPDVAVLDISMPGLSGLEIARQISVEGLSTLPVILTMYNEEEYLDEAMELGVRGYLLKDSTTTEIVDCIKSIIQGGFYISNELTSYLIKNKKNKSSKNEVIEKLESLTPAERQVLKLLSLNKTSTQIADELFISSRTVQNHRMNISHKLGLSGHNKLLLFAIEYKSLL